MVDRHRVELYSEIVRGFWIFYPGVLFFNYWLVLAEHGPCISLSLLGEWFWFDE